MTTYFEWDYDQRRVTEYKRSGKCNQCGACCRAFITFTHVMPPRAGDSKKGGPTTDGRGVWQEVNEGRWRYFYAITIEDGELHCQCLTEDNRCKAHDDPERSKICQVWPITPSNIAPFPECGWSFEVVNHWPIDEED